MDPDPLTAVAISPISGINIKAKTNGTKSVEIKSRTKNLAISAGPSQRVSRRTLHRAPGRRLPRRAGGARRRVLHPGRVKRRAPAALGVARELEVVALAVHPDDDVPDSGPRVEPGPERPEGPVVRRPGKPSAATSSRPR